MAQNDIRDEVVPLPLLHTSDECFTDHVPVRLSLPRSVTVVGPRLYDSEKGQGERRGCQYNAAYGPLSQDHSTTVIQLPGHHDGEGEEIALHILGSSMICES